jgi:hypothetical protein
MTPLQRMLYAIGFGRFKRYRRWVGGRWAERYIEPTSHSSEYLFYHPPPRHSRWELDPDARFNDHTNAIEQWPITLPNAHVRIRK